MSRFSMRALLTTCALSGLLLGAGGQTRATLTLDALSFISFGEREAFAIPSGSTIRFDFSTPNGDGSVPFTIQPAGVSIPPVDLDQGRGQLIYGLAAPASGVLFPGPGARRLDFVALVSVTRVTERGQGTYTYSLPFTTETAAATNLSGSAKVKRSGTRLIEAARYVQLVGATTNRANAVPEPGAAVYGVLSGTFDQIP